MNEVQLTLFANKWLIWQSIESQNCFIAFNASVLTTTNNKWILNTNSELNSEYFQCFSSLEFGKMLCDELRGPDAEEYISKMLWLLLSSEEKQDWIEKIGTEPSEMHGFIETKINFLFSV